MATYVEIDDPDDPRLADYRDLRDVQLRQSLEAEHGLFLAEGEKVVRRAAEAGLPGPLLPDGPTLARRAGRRARSAPTRPCYVVSEAARRAGHRLPRPPRAPWPRWSARRCRRSTRCSSGARTVVVCEDVVDHTNVGAIFRSAAALGVDAVLLAPAVRRPALPPLGQGRHGRGVRRCRGPACPTGTTRCPISAARGFTTVALTLADGRRRRSRRPWPDWTGWPWSSGRRVTALSARWQHAADAPGGDPDAGAGSTPSTSPPPRRWPATSRLPRNRSPERLSFLLLCAAWGGTGWPRLRRRSSDLVAQVSDYAIIGLDPQGTITTWNLGAEKRQGVHRATRRSGAASRCSTPRRTGAPGCRSSCS